MDNFPIVKLRSLDKVTARTMTFEARVGSTLKFGSLYIKVQACRKAPPIETPESASFLQIWEVAPDQKAEWVFSGWMYASSPGLSSMDHPIYDVWVLDCLEKKSSEAQAEKDEAKPGEGEVPEENVTDKPASAMGEAAPQAEAEDAQAAPEAAPAQSQPIESEPVPEEDVPLEE
jgi:hypothetical protein